MKISKIPMMSLNFAIQHFWQRVAIKNENEINEKWAEPNNYFMTQIKISKKPLNLKKPTPLSSVVRLAAT